MRSVFFHGNGRIRLYTTHGATIKRWEGITPEEAYRVDRKEKKDVDEA
jgi:hypothetical protein